MQVLWIIGPPILMTVSSHLVEASHKQATRSFHELCPVVGESNSVTAWQTSCSCYQSSLFRLILLLLDTS